MWHGGCWRVLAKPPRVMAKGDVTARTEMTCLLMQDWNSSIARIQSIRLGEPPNPFQPTSHWSLARGNRLIGVAMTNTWFFAFKNIPNTSPACSTYSVSGARFVAHRIRMEVSLLRRSSASGAGSTAMLTTFKSNERRLLRRSLCLGFLTGHVSRHASQGWRAWTRWRISALSFYWGLLPDGSHNARGWFFLRLKDISQRPWQSHDDRVASSVQLTVSCCEV